ncbi:MAG: peptidylprolyl isomerase [Treponema sp.]|jgi:hypothetical protein|nr:peptidylprolyl isomerase [Treponema sp.]
MAKAKKKHQESDAEGLFHRLKANPPLFIGTIAILVLVIVAFVFLPAIPNIGDGADRANPAFGYYGDIPINVMQDNYFGRTVDLFSRYGFFSGNDSTMWQQAFYMALTHTAVLDEMKKAGYKAPEEQVNREMAQHPDFLENGRFSVTKYRNYDKNRLSSLWKATEEDYIEKQYKNAYGGLPVSTGEKKLIGEMSSLERTFRMVMFPRSAYPDSEVASYGASNPAPFNMVHLSKITLGSEKDARQVRDSVLNGSMNFEDAARTRSTDVSYKDQGGDMGVRMAFDIYTMIPDETERQTVLSLKNGEYSDIVKDPNGWAFYRAEQNPYAADLSQSENLAKVRAYMSQMAGGVVEGWLVARAEEFVSRLGEDGFEQAAEDAGLEIKLFGPVSLNYGNLPVFNTLDTNDAAFREAIYNENFWHRAFTVPLDSPSAPFTLGTDVVILEALEETVKDETGKALTADFFVRHRSDSINEADIRTAVTSSEKTRDNFLMTYFQASITSQF